MSDMKGRAGSRNPDRSTADGSYRALRALRDGTMTIADFYAVLSMEGRIFTANVGTLTTPVTFRVGLTALQPELVIDVPSGTTILPISITTHWETSAGTLSEFVCQTSAGNVGAGTSTVVTPQNMATDAPSATRCSVYRTYSGNGSATVNPLEFYRNGYAFADAANDPNKKFEWSAYNHVAPVIVGAGALVIYCDGTGTAPAGYIKATWAELQTSWIV